MVGLTPVRVRGNMNCCDKKTSNGDKGKMNSDQGRGGVVGLLTGPRRWWLFGAIGVIAGLTFGWEQLVLFGIAPILISLLPCLIMCGLGFCMMKCKDKKGSATAVDQTSEAGDVQSMAPQPKVSDASHSTRAF